MVKRIELHISLNRFTDSSCYRWKRLEAKSDAPRRKLKPTDELLEHVGDRLRDPRDGLVTQATDLIHVVARGPGDEPMRSHGDKFLVERLQQRCMCS